MQTNSNSNTAVSSLMEGYEFVVFGTTFRMIGGVAHPLVMTEEGEILPESETVILPDGTRYPADECVGTAGGAWCLASEAIEVLAGYALPTSPYRNARWYSPDELEEAREDDSVRWVEGRSAYYLADDTVTLENGEICHENDAVLIGGEFYSDDDPSIQRDGRGDYFLEDDDDYFYCEETREYWHVDEGHYCEDRGVTIYGDGDDCDYCRCAGRDCVGRYHSCGGRVSLFSGRSGWLVGFEVEKNSVGDADSEGDYVGETDLFAGWETDASCGIEGVTHAYDPLDPHIVERFKAHVAGARTELAAPTDRTCGGHINLSCDRLASFDLMDRFRRYAGLWYAVYRLRLNNGYCNVDKKMEGTGDKYCPVRRRAFGIEVRLPSRVSNADVLLNRFEWVGLTCTAIDEGDSFAAYCHRCMPILVTAYRGDRAKIASILRLARQFNRYLQDGIIHPSIQQWV